MTSARRVYLLRHAKSSWDNAHLSDHERPLAARGRRDAARVATHLARGDAVPQLVLCSSAARTRETLEYLQDALGSAEVRLLDELYGADEEDVFDLLRGLETRVSSVMVVGHNPTIEELAVSLAGDDSPALARMRSKFPTAGLAILAFALDPCRNLTPGTGRLVDFVIPRDLPDA